MVSVQNKQQATGRTAISMINSSGVRFPSRDRHAFMFEAWRRIMSPLLKGKKNVSRNIRELVADNKKKGKAKGAGGKARPMKQIVAIALRTAGVPKKKK